MLGVTVGLGEGWKECAERAARRMSKHTGLECIVMHECPTKQPLNHPWWAKLWAQDCAPGEDVLFFDADMICQRDWNPQELLESYDFAWVLSMGDRPHMCPQVPGECKRFGLDPDRYGNSGMFLIHRKCPVLKRAQLLHPACGRWPEQTAISAVLQWSDDIKVRLLPSTYNYVVRKGQHKQLASFRSATNLHLIGLQGNAERLAGLQERMKCT